MMAPTLKTVVMLLASLQFTHQASLSNDFYKNKNLLDSSNNQLIFYPSFNAPSVVKSKESPKYESVRSEEQKSLNFDRSSASNFRAKRQLNQDSDLDAEIISNDPEMFPHGKSMPLTTDNDDDTPKSQHEAHESILLHEEDIDAETSNMLRVFKDNRKEGNETSNHINMNNKNYNKEEPNAMSDAEHITPNLQDQNDNIEENLQNEEDAKGEVLQNANVEKEDTADLEDNVPVSTNYMKEDEVELIHNGKHSNGNERTSILSDDSMASSDSINMHNRKEVIPEEEFMNDDALIHLRALDNDPNDTEEGSGDMTGYTTDINEHFIVNYNKDSNSTTNDGFFEKMPPDAIDIDIDSDSTTERTIEEKGRKGEEVSPISDPTQGALNVDNEHKIFVPPEENKNEELPLPLPTENFSNAQFSQTYDPKTIVNPFNIDSPSAISESIGKALGIIDSFETTTENEELEGSGQSVVFDDNESFKNSLEDEAVIEINPLMLDLNESTEEFGNQTFNKQEDELKEITELPIVTKHHYVQFNPELGPSDGENSMSEGEITTQPGVMTKTESTSEPLTELPIETVEYITKNSEASNELGGESDPTSRPENGYDLHSNDKDSMSTNSVTEITTQSGVMAKTESTSESSTELPIEKVLYAPEISEGYPINRPENGDEVPLIPGNNEMGKNGKIIEPSDVTDSTSSSSTGSFIVLGAILATIVLLLGYSIIKSRRQKQRAAQIPEETPETELNIYVKDSLLKNGHGPGPGNGLNGETGKLLNENEESDYVDLKDDGSYPTSNNVNGGNGTSNQYNKVPQTEDPNMLSEVKVNEPNAASPSNLDNLNQHVANGVGLKNSLPDHSLEVIEPKPPLADDKTSLLYGTKPEAATAKIVMNLDSIPKTPTVIVRGPANVQNVTY